MTQIENVKTMNIFISGSQTENMMSMIDMYLKPFKALHPDHKICIKVVNSPYNASKATQSWKNFPMEKINVPVFGVRIPEALGELFETKRVQDAFHLFNVPLPKMGFDTFVQKYGCETMDRFAAYLQNTNETEIKFGKFLENFSARLKSLDTITSMNDWDNFMLSVGFTEGWKNNLFFEDFLMMFGFTHEEATNLLNTKIEKKKGDTVKITDVREEYVNWTIKCTSCWRYSGCMTDLVAAVFAAMEKTFTTQKEVDGKLVNKTSREKEDDVVDTILSYVEWLKNPNRSLWVPDMQFMDCEMDDMYSIIINDLNCRIVGPEERYFKMVAQLPKRSQQFEPVWTFLIKRGFTVFHDEESTNGNPILDTFKTILTDHKKNDIEEVNDFLEEKVSPILAAKTKGITKTKSVVLQSEDREILYLEGYYEVVTVTDKVRKLYSKTKFFEKLEPTYYFTEMTYGTVINKKPT